MIFAFVDTMTGAEPTSFWVLLVTSGIIPICLGIAALLQAWALNLRRKAEIKQVADQTDGHMTKMTDANDDLRKALADVQHQLSLMQGQEKERTEARAEAAVVAAAVKADQPQQNNAGITAVPVMGH